MLIVYFILSITLVKETTSFRSCLASIAKFTDTLSIHFGVAMLWIRCWSWRVSCAEVTVLVFKYLISNLERQNTVQLLHA